MQKLLQSLWDDIAKILLGTMFTLLLICSFLYVAKAFAQEYKVYEQYPITGVTKPFPTKTIIVEDTTVKVYGNDIVGNRDIFPEKTIVVEKPIVTSPPTSPQTNLGLDPLPQGAVDLGLWGKD